MQETITLDNQRRIKNHLQKKINAAYQLASQNKGYVFPRKDTDSQTSSLMSSLLGSSYDLTKQFINSADRKNYRQSVQQATEQSKDNHPIDPFFISSQLERKLTVQKQVHSKNDKQICCNLLNDCFNFCSESSNRQTAGKDWQHKSIKEKYQSKCSSSTRNPRLHPYVQKFSLKKKDSSFKASQY